MCPLNKRYIRRRFDGFLLTVKTAQAFLPIDRSSKQDSLQYSNFDWTNEPYAYTISAMLNTRTSPARRNTSSSWLVNSSKPIIRLRFPAIFLLAWAVLTVMFTVAFVASVSVGLRRKEKQGTDPAPRKCLLRSPWRLPNFCITQRVILLQISNRPFLAAPTDCYRSRELLIDFESLFQNRAKTDPVHLFLLIYKQFKPVLRVLTRLKSLALLRN